MHFSVSGEFVTETARSWFWEENKPYQKVEEFLLSCMCGSDLKISDLKRLAKEVVLGKKKFEGNTIDNTFGMVDDETNIKDRYNYMAYLQDIDFVEKTLETNIKNLEYYEKRDEVHSLKKDDYGWLDTQGNFHMVDWCKHQEWALEYIENHYNEEDFCRFMAKGRRENIDYTGSAGDFLIFSKGWILLHNPRQLEANITRDESKALTKAQKEFLFDYFTMRKMFKKANKIWS